ncbi:hypothetical protein HY346_00965 [Candidatus Microgenomates bacterium]|nr:hypothetical protein [Candidatus Microgenomates bacterium]
MATFPYVLFINHESDWWDSETDTNVKLNRFHYTQLARYKVAPWRGSYGLHVHLDKGTADAFVQEDTDFDLALAGTRVHAFPVYISRNLTMADGDRFTIFALQSAGAVDEAVIEIRRSGNAYQLVAAETSGNATLRATDIERGRWYWLELYTVVDAGVGNDGTIDFYINNRQVSTQLASLDQAAFAQVRVGTFNIDAGTTSGDIVFGPIYLDNATRFRPLERFPKTIPIVASQQLFVGPGGIAAAAILSDTAGDIIRFYDVDRAPAFTNETAGGEQGFVIELQRGTATAQTFTGPFQFENGCYAEVTQTTTRGHIILALDQIDEWVSGPVYYSQAGIIDLGMSRSAP